MMGNYIAIMSVEEIKKSIVKIEATMTIEKIKKTITKPTSNNKVHKFGLIFMILVDGSYISFIDAVHCLRTCTAMYKRKRWFGNRRPMFKMINKEEYQKKKEQKKKEFWKKTKIYKKEKEVIKAKKLYFSVKDLLFKFILRKINDDFATNSTHRSYLTNRKTMSDAIMTFRFVSVDVVPGTLVPYKKIVRILKRKAIQRIFRKDVNNFIALYYPKLAIWHGINNLVNRGSHDMGIRIYLNYDKRPPTSAVRGYRGGKNQRKQQFSKKKKCAACNCYH